MASERFELTRDDLRFLQVITVSTAKDVLKEEQQHGFTRDPLTVVDGRAGVPEERVKFGGQISYTDRHLGIGLGIKLALVYLYRRSPYGRFPKPATGGWFRPLHYRDQHTVTLNGREMFTSGEIMATPAGLERLDEFVDDLSPGDRVAIVNPMPYARRIEHGKGVRQAARGPSFSNLRGDRRANPASVAHWSSPDQVYRRAFRYVSRKTGGRRSGLFIKYELTHLRSLGYQFTSDGQQVDQLYPSLVFRVGRGHGGSSAQ